MFDMKNGSFVRRRESPNGLAMPSLADDDAAGHENRGCRCVPSTPLGLETMRRYMSKSQRACDNCRARKSACRIDSCPPCRLCHLSGRECTFDKTSRSTRAAPGPALQASPSDTNQFSPGITNATLVGSGPNASSANDVQFGQRNGDGLGMNDINDQGSQHLASFAPDYSLPSDLDDVQDSFWLDQSMMDIGMQAFDYMDASPNHVAADQAGIPSASLPQGVGTTSIVCGLTGDMDPYLMQRYNFDSDNNFVFKRLTVRSMSQDVHPVQQLVSNGSGDVDKVVNDTAREHLEQLVSPDVGVRLISLYETRFPWQTCAQHS